MIANIERVFGVLDGLVERIVRFLAATTEHEADGQGRGKQ